MATRSNLRHHFTHQHHQDMLCMLKEGTVPFLKCEHCSMHVSWQALSCGHFNMACCHEGAVRAQQRSATHEGRLACEVAFMPKGEALESAPLFRHLGGPLSVLDEDWPAAHHNLKKMRQCWAWVSCVPA